MTEEILEQIMAFIVEKQPESKVAFDDLRRKKCSALKISQPANRKLLKAYHRLIKKGSITADTQIEHFLRKANIRSMSGIAVVTSLTKPYMCPGKCVYCPTEVRMPKSYLASEPAAARSMRLDFDPYELMQKRIEMMEDNGHPCDKIEYIVKGGTWNAYPLKYQYWYILESFRACNNLKSDTPSKRTCEDDWKEKTVKDLQKEMLIEQEKNESTKYRIIGLTLETRPDAISPKTIWHMRNMGCTRIELGLQAPDDKILDLIQRGHSVDQFRRAMHLLRKAGFKVDLHFMPDLPGSTPDHDVEMYKSLFTDESLKPDMVKIYPNTVIPSAELYEWYKDGRYTPYKEEELFEALLQMKEVTPRYCRISRLIRDIPENEIMAGNRITNLRQHLETILHKRGKICQCLRCREIGRQMKHVPKDTTPILFIDEYQTVGGKEFFITFEDPKRIAVFGFLRLRLPEEVHKDINWISQKEDTNNGKELFSLLPEIKDCAFIRELHTYGQLIGIGQKGNSDASQHKGLGKRLIKAAEDIVQKHGYTKCAVISGVGVKGYYEKLDYKKEGTYVVKHFN
ncbi:MAG: tRNA uridine(34) 5-carboxymethylaminomethyl modification radical SAM/GNAT enzyme Elp3 [Candidatus Magasanikbacteria bacterium]|nr:tRNA uridine(34) 5-carboxymethylaminomethyl modification radical SAM/GNAT enzyme Elp3 [Candidatus Magasanikbacteria bacterium]MBT4221442.1 tRNA uridine(34) 5-carboxymethylaminomethyl modification radical SAM/GNAT enzyme Elp3 [Candidatus Magasanikbacteria bacterium]MBT4350710.1 tRNA uridine(34) 5-carboxymethylaminomethyl modification radical SAM/GNAT enzyme Elp3 [Candidatus Magasanikbacteria bacterium]MBT4541614.1 tRNA uridine(34) 5-carboxymethylaminomethyl modification radical SAM/GNAT enzyme